jgi:MoaE-MoaD fusion protein
MNDRSEPSISGNQSISLRVLFFANLKDRTGTKVMEVSLPSGSRVSDLKNWIIQRFPQIEPALPTCLVAVDREFAADGDELSHGQEIALFPPVSGGGHNYPTIFQITEKSLDLNHLIAQITLPTTGACCIFTGVVRGITSRGKSFETSYLEYEAYEEMAEEKMVQVASEIRSQWPLVEGIAIVQRVGRLDPGTPTVLIACSASHRDTGVFEAARYGIDRLKEIVPVWKKEVGPHGEQWIEGKYFPKSGE